MNIRKKIIHNDYRKAIKFCLIYQIVLGILAGAMLDGGQCIQYWTVSMTAFWPSAILLIIRNKDNPRKIDILYIKWGFILIMVVVPFVLDFVWRLRGIK